MTRVIFLLLLFRNFEDQLSSKFHRFVILCICWDQVRRLVFFLPPCNNQKCPVSATRNRQEWANLQPRSSRERESMKTNTNLFIENSDWWGNLLNYKNSMHLALTILPLCLQTDKQSLTHLSKTSLKDERHCIKANFSDANNDFVLCYNFDTRKLTSLPHVA